MSVPLTMPAEPVCSAEDRARADHYAVIARLFNGPPDAALLAALAQAGRSLGGDRGALPQAWTALGVAASAPLGTVADEFDALFISVSRPVVLLNASWYLTGFLQEEPLAEVRDDLARLGLGRRFGARETEDHVAALAEVMRHLIVSGTDGAGLEHQDEFFARHLAPWYARLADTLADAPQADFYARAASLLRAFLDIERAAFDMLPRGVR